ncbi:hypothetical protein RBSH_01938 [Rhodopirellula baltica SH28]|uniref:Uncharacterized protein n=1 Tax=Rhodopirellula baltica SH28 TaxID=993517 RepID=K5EA66_RHOBT|nr:hypothetical protein RBSH_01938 [Rhodopirellula baltica SH28]
MLVEFRQVLCGFVLKSAIHGGRSPGVEWAETTSLTGKPDSERVLSANFRKQFRLVGL